MRSRNPATSLAFSRGRFRVTEDACLEGADRAAAAAADDLDLRLVCVSHDSAILNSARACL